MASTSTATTYLNSSFLNSTQPTPPKGSSASPTMGISILSLALIVGLPGNFFIIWTILGIMKKRTVTCVLILHLAVADSVVLLTAPLFIHLLATGAWVFGVAICKICHYIGCLSMYASIYLICFMSLDRFLAVYKPFVSQKVRTKLVVMEIIVSIWALSFLFAIPMPFYRVIFPHPKSGMPICIPYHTSPNHIIFQYVFETLIGFIIPFTAILTSYIYIGMRLKSAKFQRKRKTGRLISVIVVTFALFWLPYHIINVIQVLGNLTSGTSADSLKQAAKKGRPTVTALAFLSSSINPILYSFAGSSFIKTAGLGFMAKLFEGTASEASSVRKASQAFQRQRSRNDSVELEKMEVNPSNKSTSTTMSK
ncbi:leukotriene B4 receptor 1-like [Ambystoma mexicanum]|uniref:leukotriene B4 receptor 1-like n=1 Tax=Ambystoma mexicanum TaxID=8296 RepID=UPI0037E7283E